MGWDMMRVMGYESCEVWERFELILETRESRRGGFCLPRIMTCAFIYITAWERKRE